MGAALSVVVLKEVVEVFEGAVVVGELETLIALFIGVQHLLAAACHELMPGDREFPVAVGTARWLEGGESHLIYIGTG